MFRTNLAKYTEQYKAIAADIEIIEKKVEKDQLENVCKKELDILHQCQINMQNALNALDYIDYNLNKRTAEKEDQSGKFGQYEKKTNPKKNNTEGYAEETKYKLTKGKNEHHGPGSLQTTDTISEFTESELSKSEATASGFSEDAYTEEDKPDRKKNKKINENEAEATTTHKIKRPSLLTRIQKIAAHPRLYYRGTESIKKNEDEFKKNLLATEKVVKELSKKLGLHLGPSTLRKK